MGLAPVPVQNRFSDAQQTEIIRLFNSGSTHKALAEQFNVPRKTMMKLCHHLGLGRSAQEAGEIAHGYTEEEIERVRVLRDAGRTIPDIVAITGLSQSHVGRICSKYDLRTPKARTDYDKLKSEYDSGLNLKQLAAKYAISTDKIRTELHARGTVMHTSPMSYIGGTPRKEKANLPEFSDTVEWFRDAYLTRRYSTPQIAEFLGRSPGYVQSKLSRYGIPLRTISESITRLDHCKILEDYQELGSLIKVADKHFCTAEIIGIILRDNGIEIRSTSEILSGEGNPFFGKQHPEEVKQACREAGALGGAKFWVDHPEYIEVVRAKQKELWNDVEKRAAQSVKISKLRKEGKLQSRRGSLVTRWGEMKFDSSYEMEFIEWCEKDDRIVMLERDFDLIEYEFEGTRNFVPDFRLWFSNGDFLVVEIKSDYLAMQPKEQAKIAAGFGVLQNKFIVAAQDFNKVAERIRCLE